MDFPNGNQSFFTVFAVQGYAVALSYSLFAPVERVKVILQTHRLSKVSKAEILKGPREAFKHVRTNQGIMAFWNGNGTYVFKEALNLLIRLGIARGLVSMRNSNPLNETNFSLSFKKYMILFVSSFLSLSLTYPLEVIRIRLMKEMTNKQETKVFKGFGECLRTILLKEGFRSVFKGYFFSAAVLIPYMGVSFGTYETLKNSKMFNTDYENLAYSVILSQILLYPLDTVRKRLQTNGGIDHLKLYTGARDCLKTIRKNEGMKGFYAGFLMNSIRIMPQMAFQLSMFNQAFQFFEEIKEENVKMMV